MAIQDRLIVVKQRVAATHQRLGRWAWPTWAASAAVTVIAITFFFVVPGPGGIRSAAEMPVSTLVYDMRDQPVFNIFREHRTPVALADMSPHVIRAVLAVEDERFYSHGGIDVRRIVGAAIANVRQGELAQGGVDHHPATGAQVVFVGPQVFRAQGTRGGACRAS
ncbi:MAG: transglycosylase domain-containing protein [Acidobacteria bacterium]|nr:transglycosylase domain-containing protein [Acidobacteriota bacterium]